jgi:hypothetical protein
MNYSDMAAFVRAQADTDADDAPDATLRVYAAAAYKDVRRRVFPWPDKKTQFTFPTVPGQSFYPYSAMTAPDMEYVISVAGSAGVLGYVSPEQFLELSTSNNSGTPRLFVPDTNGMYLFPTPDVSETINVVGYRRFAVWPTNDASEPDLSRDFDEVICWFMLSKYYENQEDLELVQSYMQDYEVGLAHQIEATLRSSATTAGPRIFGNQSVSLPAPSAGATFIAVNGA